MTERATIDFLRKNFPRPTFTNHSAVMRRAVWVLEQDEIESEGGIDTTEKRRALLDTSLNLDEKARAYIEDRSDVKLGELLLAWNDAQEVYLWAMGTRLPVH